MASTNEDSGHHLVMATSGEQSEGRMATSGEQCEGHMATSGEQSEGHMVTSGEQSEGHMATSGEQSEGHMDTSEPQGHLAISDVDMASSAGEIFTTEDDSGNSVVSSDEEPQGHLVLAGSAETEEDLELLSQPPVKRLRTGDRPSGGSQVANTLNIITGQAGQATLGRGTLDLRTDEAKKIFLPTEPFKDVKQKLKAFGHVTICGASGEGKTTMALVLGSQYRDKGYEVVFVDNIEKFDLDQCLSSHPRVFLIVDDMFGTVGLSSNTSQVKTFLNNLLLHLEQKRSAEKLQSEMHECSDAVGKSRKKVQSQPEFQTKDSDAVGKSRKKVQSQPEFQTKDIRVVFTSKSYNFHDGLAKLQYEGFKLFKGQTVMDLTTQDKYWLSDKEKKTIFERHRKALGDCSMQHIPDYSELEICSNIFGFPLICKLCFEFSSFYKNAKSFFKEPLFYLRLELKHLLEERNDRSAILVLMLLSEDKLDLSKLDSEGEDKEMDSLVKTVLQMMSKATRSGMYKAAKGLRGTFFTRGDTVGFAHSSIYDACACALYNISPIFVLKHCSDDFLFERVQGDKVEETKVDDHLHLIYVSENYDDLLTTRFTQSIKQGRFSKSVTHPILKQDATVFKLLKKLHCDRTKHLWFHKKEKGQCFLYWAVLGHNARLITDIEHTAGEEFTQGEISEAMEGCARSNNVTALKWLFSRSEKHDHQLTMNRLLLVAAESGSSDILVYLLQEGADINTRDKGMQNIFHLVCKSGMEKTLKVLLTRKPGNNVINSVDVNGRTPVMVASHTGSEGCFKLLQTTSNLNVKDKHGSGIIHLACGGGNTAIVQHVLSPSNINSRGRHGWTAVMVAAVSGHQSVFDLLVSNQADLTLVDTSGDSLLHLACRGGNTAIVQHVLFPSNINSRGEYGWTAVMQAAVSGHQSVFDLLVSNQADLTLVDTDGDSLLHLACQGGNTAIVQHVLSPSNINSTGRYGWTAVMQAAVNGHQSVFDLLVSNQADLTLVDICGDSLLHLACRGGNTAIVQHVLSPSNINSRGEYGWTAVMVAAFSGHQSVFDLLVSNQADLTLVSTSGDSLLHLACQGGNTAIVQHVLSPSNINSRGEYGWTAVMQAAVSGHHSVFDLLVSNQADLTLVSTSGDSLLHLACQGGNTAIVQHVLSPSNINSKEMHGWTAAMRAAVRGHHSVFDLLVSNQADLTLVSTSGDSLLHHACGGGNTAIVQHVLSPSNINSRGIHGLTAVMVAAVRGHHSVFDLLVSNQADLTLVSTSGDSLLHHACRGGNTAIVQHVLSPSNINSRGEYGWTAVMQAAVNGHQSVFDLLVSNQADLTLVDIFGDSLLHLACQVGNTAIVQHVLSPSNINSTGRYGWTAVMQAAVNGHQSVFDLLVSNQADLTLVDIFGDSLLHLACGGGNTAIVQHVLSPSNINSTGRYGWTAAMMAAVNGHQSVFDLLVSNQADLTLVDIFGDSLLHLACEGGNTAIVQHVLSPSNINSRGIHGLTAVMVAAVSGHQSVFDLLVSNQADLTLVSTSGDSLLHHACRGGNTAIVQHVLSPSNINSRGEYGWTAVMKAAVNGHQSVFDVLVSNQADLTLVDIVGDSLLHHACRGGNTAIVQHVLSPSNINSTGRYGWTAVMKAAVSGHQSVFDLLVSNQADLTLVDTDGDSLLHHACQGGNTAIVQHVLSPSNINSKGMHGWTAAMMAAVSGHHSVFDLLVSNQADLTLVDTSGHSLLHHACRGGNTAIVQHVLTPSNINSRGEYGWTAVMQAAVSGHQSVFDLLVSNQADLTLVSTSGDSLLHLACRGGDTAIVQHVLSPSNINSRGMHGWTAVMMAAVNGHQSVFDLLVSNQADLTLVDTSGDSLLHHACQGGNTAIVQHVLSPSNTNSRGEYGWTAVMQAAVSGHQSVFDLLVSNQADLTLVDTSGDSLLHHACRGGNTAIVQHVLSPSNINSRGEYGWTAVMQAAVSGHQSVFDLVSNQADLTLVDISGDSLLHLACRGGNTAIVQHILSPSNINSRGEYGWTAVMQAAVNGHQSVFDLLVSNQADLTLVDTDGDSLLHHACRGGNTAIVQHVLSPSNINSKGMHGWTAAMMAAVSGHQSVFDLLVSNQADLTLVDTDGDSLLHLACRGGNTAIVQHVLSPSNINSKGMHGWTAAMMAAVSGHQSVFDLLVSNQADLTLVDTSGDSLLHHACRGGNTAIVQHVLSPSNINSKGMHGWTAAMMAAVSGHQSVFDLLVSNQADLTLVSTSGDSLLHLACRGGNTAIVQHVLSPSNINSKGMHGWTAAMMAAVSGHQSVFDLLVSNQADLTLVDTDGDSLLHHACRGGNTAIVQHVLSPSNINSKGMHGWTAAMMAAVSGHQSVFDLLVSNQADLTLVSTSGDSLLHLACRGGNTAIVQHVLSPSNINSRGEYGWTAVMQAAVSGHQSVFDLLVSNQADLTLVDTSGDSLLHLACRGGNTAIVQHVLSPSNINSRGEYGWTAVMQAAVSGHQSVFDLLVSNQADLTLVSTSGDSLLHLACRGGNTAIVQHVLSPSNINSRGEYGWTAVMQAAVSGHQSVFDLLVSNQADLTLVSTSGDSLLHLACRGGNTAIVQHVLSPSNINSRGEYGWTAVMQAAVSGHQSVFDLLVSNQADLTLVSTSGDSLLHLACRGGNTAIVQHVLSPSNINSKGMHGWTAAMMAAVSGHQSVFDLLVSNQADLTLVDTSGDSLLHLACRGGNTAIVQHVLSPSNINSRGEYGWTAVMQAAVSGHQSVFDLLVSNQADLTLVSTSGDSLLHLACQGGNTAIVQHVLTPSNINSRGRHGWTAVMQAAVSGHQSVFDLLVSNQADLTLVDTSGDSLLHLACRGGNTAIVQHVLSPSNINSRGSQGYTPVMKAVFHGHQDVVDLLVQHKADLTLLTDSNEDIECVAQMGGHPTLAKYLQTVKHYATMFYCRTFILADLETL
ncbi:uncharacterized protein [Haliotis cracherodii]|uniref:uncharacterized protein n=1 Tax=Haliotis cracherodii TaxID=6455 RepID=UPI0039ED9474